MTLKKQTFLGTFWVFVETFFLRGVTFVASIYLARLLGPKEYGLVGMVAVFIAIGTTLVDSGLSSSLIRTKNPNDEDFSTVFYLNLGISIAIYAIMYLIAPLIASFYNQDILVDILRVYCLSFIFSAFSTIQLAKLDAEMNFRRSTLLGLPGAIIGVIIGCVMGNYGYGVWSIVYMFLVTQVVKSLCLWLFSSWKPKLIFSKSRAKYHYNFGYKLLLSGLLNTGFTYIYNILIGRFYPVQTLGYYERARYFNEYPSTLLTGIVTRVTYPLLSKIQDDKERLLEIYRRLNTLLFFCIAPCMMGIAAIAKPLFLLVLGEEWLAAVPIFQVLALGYMLFPIHILNLNIIKVLGRSDLFLSLEIIKKIVVVVSIALLFKFGIMGLMWSSVVSSVLAFFINSHFSGGLINYKTKRQVLDIIPTLVLSCVMFLVVMEALKLAGQFGLMIQIFIGSISGIVFYIGTSYILKISPFLYFIQIVKKRKI
ncbi:lipopolysaccharide biosynthesis protein [Sphingobacterium sp. Lzh-3]|uniref:lipopolysaccharide biosynthesis protein n=1 Tax=Sphingobacterium sp. Lzh-3 TaxID=3382150 RepID=UPI00398D2FF6